MNKIFNCCLIVISILTVSCKKEIIQDVKQAPPHIPVYVVVLGSYLDCYVNTSSSVDTVVSGGADFSADNKEFSPTSESFSSAEGYGNYFDHSSHFLAIYSAPVWSVTCNETGNFSLTDTMAAPLFPNAKTLSFPIVHATQDLTIDLSGATNYDYVELDVQNNTENSAIYEVGASAYGVSGQTSITLTSGNLYNGVVPYMPYDPAVQVILRFTKQTSTTINGHAVYFRKVTTYYYKGKVTF